MTICHSTGPIRVVALGPLARHGLDLFQPVDQFVPESLIEGLGGGMVKDGYDALRVQRVEVSVRVVRERKLRVALSERIDLTVRAALYARSARTLNSHRARLHKRQTRSRIYFYSHYLTTFGPHALL